MAGLVPAALALTALPPAAAATTAPALADQFVVRKGGDLYLGGKIWNFSGTNNYYPMYKSRTMVDALLAKTAASGFQVLRIWGSHDVGDPNNPTTDRTSPAYSIDDPTAEGAYLQYWDSAAGRPAYNDGPNGMERLDYIIATARANGVRLVIPLVNNWNNFGGMDQYVQWAGKSYHDDFYTDPTIRGWYKDWISHVLNRTNSITGVKYKDDPTILMWELGNEPRCVSAGAKTRSANCTTDTITAWADVMSTYIKSVDPKHLVGSGDEGFYADQPTSTDWTANGVDGVDALRIAKLKNIDVLSWHLYPDGWRKDAAWGATYIARRAQDARKIGKVGYMGEFGLLDKTKRNPVYQTWLDTFRKNGGDGFSYWILSDLQDDGTLYPDFDGFTVYCPSPVCTTMSNESRLLRNEQQNFAPTADVDTVTTPFDTAVTVRVLDNDVTWNGRRLQRNTLDLNPATAGVQSSVTVAGGTFVADSAGVVTFTPKAGFSGKAITTYTVRDSERTLSNAVALTVIVKPDPTAAIMIGDFETGTDGFVPRNWNSSGNSVQTTTAWASRGTSSLEVTSSGDWFGVDFATPLDLSAKSTVKVDLQTPASAGTSVSIALQTGSAFTFCQGPFTWFPAGGTYEVSVDLLTGLGCAAPDLADVRAINLYFNAGTFTIDALRAE